MSKKKNNNYVKEDKKAQVKPYKNPTSTIWGKIIICTLALAMALGGLVSLLIMFFM